MKANTSYLILIISISLVLYSCENDIKTVNLIAGQGEALVERGKDVEILYSDSGFIHIMIKAPTVISYKSKEPYTEMPDGVEIYFYGPDREVESFITADYGIRYEDEEIMKVRGNVIAQNSKGEKLNAEELIWDEKEEKIYSDKFVKIQTEDEIIYGEGFEANQEFTDYKIKNIKGTINIVESDTTDTE
ncbi:MAG: LPS export ABC transporter periplasmic protein LptC [Bacteroidetes bacterium]|nr:LPS export ABC transporter periplasmic protein LptC [Bacteroidota bacterium]